MVVRARLASALSWAAAVALLAGCVGAAALTSWLLSLLVAVWPAAFVALLALAAALVVLLALSLLWVVLAGLRDWVWERWPW